MSKSALGILAESWPNMQPNIRVQLWGNLSDTQREELSELHPNVATDTPPEAHTEPIRALSTPETPKPPEKPVSTAQSLWGAEPIQVVETPIIDKPRECKPAPKTLVMKRTQPRPDPVPDGQVQEMQDRIEILKAQVVELQAQVNQTAPKPNLRQDIITILTGRTAEPWLMATLSDSTPYIRHYGADAYDRVLGDLLGELFRMRAEKLVKWAGGTTDIVKLRKTT